MRIRFLTAIVGPRARFHAGQVIDVADPSPELLAFVDGERAEVVRDEHDMELATVPGGEPVAVLPRARQRRAR